MGDALTFAAISDAIAAFLARAARLARSTAVEFAVKVSIGIAAGDVAALPAALSVPARAAPTCDIGVA